MRVLAPELSNPDLDAAGSVGERARHAAAEVIRAAKDREFHSLGLVLGYSYDASPVIVDDGTPALPEAQEYTPTARPGARLPHRWLSDGASLYDQMGSGFSLLRLGADADVAPFAEATARGAPLAIQALRDQRLEDAYGAALLLVRPDQHVAWRGGTVDRPTASAILGQIRGA
jgi:hypothetical protein